MPYHHVDVRVDARELARLREYEASKGMSISAIMRQALRVYDMMEQTPGAYEAVQKLNEAAKAVRELNRTTEETSVAADECPAHMSGCHVRTRLPPVLDACCGPRMMWFDKHDARALFIDKRSETHPIDIGTPGTKGRAPIVVEPDEIVDFTCMPFADESFHLVVFDPPHIEREEAKGLFTRKYGHLTGDWREMLRQGFAECFRVLKPHGTLVFKWAESDHPLSEILKLTPHKPLFGHRSGKLTHWCVFMKPTDSGNEGHMNDKQSGGV